MRSYMFLSVVPVVLLVLLQAHSNDAQIDAGAQGIQGILQLAAIAGIGLLGAGGFALGLLISQGDQVKVYSEELPPVYHHHAQAEEDYSDSYGAPSHGYGAPSYKPEPSSSYGAPSYKQPGDGYGAPEAPVYGPPDAGYSYSSYRSRRGRRAVTEAARTAEAEAIIAMLVDMEPEHCYKMVICAASTGQ